MQRYFLFIFLIFTLYACFDNNDNDVEITIDAALAYDLVNNALDTLVLDGKSYILEAALWRNFMPPIDPDESRNLIAVNYLVDLDSIEVPSNIDLNKQYVIMNDSIWVADYTEQRGSQYAYKLERVSREGPEWEPGRSVTVVAEVTDSVLDTVYYIKTENIIIFAAY